MKRPTREIIQSTEFRQMIVDIYQRNDKPLHLIATEQGISVTTIRTIIREEGVTPRSETGVRVYPKVYSDEEKERRADILEAYKDGVPIADIMRMYQTSPQTIQQIVNEAGLPPRREIQKAAAAQRKELRRRERLNNTLVFLATEGDDGCC